MDGPRSLIDGPSGYKLMSIGHHGGGNKSGGGQDAGAGGGFGGGGRGQTRHERAMDRRGDRGGNRGSRQQMYPGILQGERIPEYRQRMAQQKRQAAIDAERKAKAEAAKKAQEEAAARQAAEQAAARQAAEAEAARQAQEEAARQAAAEAARVAEQQRLAAIEEQRRKDAEEAAKQRAAEEARRQADLQRAQALGTVVTTGPMASLNRPADPLPRYRGYTPMDYDASKTGSLTDQYARMLNVPFFQPFVAQDQIEGPTPQDSIFGIDSLMPNYTFDPLSQTASNPYFSAKQGGRVGRNMGGIIGFMDEPINIMYPSNQNNVLHGGISSILKKYKEIRSEL